MESSICRELQDFCFSTMHYISLTFQQAGDVVGSGSQRPPPSYIYPVVLLILYCTIILYTRYICIFYRALGTALASLVDFRQCSCFLVSRRALFHGEGVVWLFRQKIKTHTSTKVEPLCVELLYYYFDWLNIVLSIHYPGDTPRVFEVIPVC